MAEHYSKPSRRDERRKLIFGASYFRPGRRERRPERRNVNARAHARKPWEKILAPDFLRKFFFFRSEPLSPPHSIFSSVVIPYRPMKRNLASAQHLDIRSVWNSNNCLFVKEFLNFFLPAISFGIILYLLSISICKKRRIKKLWMKKLCKSDENFDRYLDRRNVHVVASSNDSTRQKDKRRRK